MRHYNYSALKLWAVSIKRHPPPENALTCYTGVWPCRGVTARIVILLSRASSKCSSLYKYFMAEKEQESQGPAVPCFPLVRGSMNFLSQCC